MMNNMTKTKFCRGIQCPKMLWMDSNMPEKGVDTASEQVFQTGNYVGEVARAYFGPYDLVEYAEDKNEMIAHTQELMEGGADNIAEAAFADNGLYCAVDLLHRTKNGWEIVEVKSSTEVKDIYLYDMAFQYYVLTQCGVNVERVCCLHINGSYERRGELDLHGLFALEDCTEQIGEKAQDVGKNAERFLKYANRKGEPPMDIGLYCEEPYKCMYREYCGRRLPQPSVFDVAGMRTKKKYQLYGEGIVSYPDLLKKTKLSDKQRCQIQSSLYQTPDRYDKTEIRNFLGTLTYPIYHLDFETFQQAVPEYDRCRPYQQIPFQYSLHIEKQGGELEHREFLAEAGSDPRRTLAERLAADIPENACVTAYSMRFEKSVIKSLAGLFPDLADRLMNICDHIHDLMTPFQKQYYYSAAMQGSCSIKAVLPALYPDDPEMDYHRLEGVHNGTEASAAFVGMKGKTPEEVSEIRQQLLKYCGLDTYAMVKVLRKLREAAK